MRVLAVDIGTGTQDIFLYDSRIDPENGFKLILPSPTMIVNRRLKQATRERTGVALTGVMMGGGPSAWAVEGHLEAGLPVFATPEAARTLNDDLAEVRALGVRIVGEEEIGQLPDSVLRLPLRDFDFRAIEKAFSDFGVRLDDLAAVAVAVFDHGAAPPGVSDRQFRFDYLDARIRAENRLSAFAYRAENIPAIMTRLQAVARSAGGFDAPLIVMDTAPAAVLGAGFDPRVQAAEHTGRCIIANVGNFHTLAFRLGPAGIEGVFEHHTGLLTRSSLEGLLTRLADSTLTHAEVFGSHGHGALVYSPEPFEIASGEFGVVATGPRRNLLRGSRLRPYQAVPFGDMMIAGCFGLLSAAADLVPEIGEPIRESLSGGGGSGTPPWEIE